MKITSAIIVCWNHEVQLFVAGVPESPGCVAHGKTHEWALKHAKSVIRLWLDTAKEFGAPIPEPKARLMLA